MSSNAFAIEKGVKLGAKLGGSSGKISPPSMTNSQFQYYPHPVIAKKNGSGTLVGIDALKGGSIPPSIQKASKPPIPPPIPSKIPTVEKSEPLLVVVPPQLPHASIHDIKLVSPIRSSHSLLEDENVQPNPQQSKKGWIMIVSTTSLFLFLLNTWAMDTPSSNAEVGTTIHTSMVFLNAMISPFLAMSIGYSMATSQDSFAKSMGVCGIASMSMFGDLFLIHKEMDDIGGSGDSNGYMLQQGIQLCGCILASIYCTWRLSLRFNSTTIDKRRRELAFMGCMFLLQCLFSFLAVFIQDPIIVLWVWSVIAWGCTLP